MVFITNANKRKIILQKKIKDLNLESIQKYFFSKYEKNELLPILELLKNPSKYFNEIYTPFETDDTLTYMYEANKPAYHKSSDCTWLKSDFPKIKIPTEITKKGPNEIKEFRKWFGEVKHLLEDKPDVFSMRLYSRWNVKTDIEKINYDNSGYIEFENTSLEKIEKEIHSLIKKAGKFYNKNEKNKTILQEFLAKTLLANPEKKIYKNNTNYSDQEVKDLLKHYDVEFKQPLKKLLIESYRIKLNPEIKIEGDLLENLGFNPCYLCHQGFLDDSILESASNIIEEHIKKLILQDQNNEIPFYLKENKNLNFNLKIKGKEVIIAEPYKLGRIKDDYKLTHTSFLDEQFRFIGVLIYEKNDDPTTKIIVPQLYTQGVITQGLQKNIDSKGYTHYYLSFECVEISDGNTGIAIVDEALINEINEQGGWLPSSKDPEPALEVFSKGNHCGLKAHYINISTDSTDLSLKVQARKPDPSIESENGYLIREWVV